MPPRTRRCLGVVLGVLILAITACAQSSSPAPLADPSLASVPPASLASATHSSNAFALDLYRRFATNSTGNIFFSPYSISTALAMTWAGAQGLTAAQFAALFHTNPGTPAPADFGFLQQAVVASAGRDVQLSIANSLWPQQGHPFLPAYLALVQNAFASGVFPVDYRTQTESARTRINSWVEAQTHDRIQNLLHSGDVSADTRLVLVNAIYFKGDWAAQFNPKDTTPGPFFLTGGANVTASFMHQRVSARFVDLPDSALSILALPYAGGNLSFVALLPHDPAGLASLEQNLTADTLDTFLARLPSAPREVDVSLPKFQLTERYLLGPTLRTLGLTDAFSPATADFSGMDGTRDLFISEAIHQAFVEVNEQGTEAAAATAVGIRTLAIVVTPSFTADHPFLFLIRDNPSGAILFLGRLASPPAVE